MVHWLVQKGYLGMDLTFGDKKELKISMIPYMQEIIDEFPDDLAKFESNPAAKHLFDEATSPILLTEEKANTFHHTVAKFMGSSPCPTRSVNSPVISDLKSESP
jgi:hypothetical protein